MGIHLQQVPIQGIKHQPPAPHSCQWVGGSLPFPFHVWDPLHKLTGWGRWGHICRQGSQEGTQWQQGAPATGQRPAPHSQGTCTLQGGKRDVGRGWGNPTTTPPCLKPPPKRTGQSVVHVKAKALDLLQRQAPVDENPGVEHGGSYGARRGLGLGVVQRKRWGRVFLSQFLVSALGGSCAHPSPSPP